MPDKTPEKKELVVVYKSISACALMFSSEAMTSSTMYPRTVQYECDICKKHHFFASVGSYILSTPSKKKLFESYCTTNHITIRDVEVV